MKGKISLILVAIFALIGFLDASYVHVKEIHAHGDPAAFQSCTINAVVSCASVLTSRYANLYGMPVSQLGIYFYEAAIIIAIALLLGLPLRRWLAWVLSIFVVGGLLFSFYLLFVSYFGVGAFCPFCLTSDATALLVTIFWFIFLAQSARTRKA